MTRRPNSWDETEHPRWPRKTPGGKGGEFRDGGPESWAEAAARTVGFGFNGGRMSHTEVASYVGRSDYTETRLAGGQTAYTRLRRYSDGRLLVHKDMSNDEEARGEVEYSLVARALGAPAPAAVWYSEPDAEVLMEYIPGLTGYEHYMAGFRNPDGTYRLTDPTGNERTRVEQQFAGTDAGILIGLVDVLGAHADRNMGNWIVEADGTPVAIDNSDTFDPDGYRGTGAVPYSSGQFARNFVGPAYHDWIDNPLHPDDIPTIRRRLEVLYRSGQLNPDSRDGVMDVLNSLEHRAKGTRRLVP